MNEQPKTRWENEDLSFKTYDHPEANGRKANIGDEEHTLTFPLDDKRVLTLRIGKLGFEALTDNLMKMLTNAPSHSDDNPRAPEIFAALTAERDALLADKARRKNHLFANTARTLQCFTLCPKCNKESEIPMGITNHEMNSNNHSCPHCHTVIQTWVRIASRPGASGGGTAG